jgi:hypothetical protein
MEILIKNTTVHSVPIFGDKEAHIIFDFSREEFNQLKKDLNEIASVTKTEVNTDTRNNRKTVTNKPGMLNYGGGAEITEIIETVSLIIGSPLLFIQLLKALAPIISKYIEKKTGRGITIKTSKFEVKVENKEDLELAIEKAKQLEEPKTKPKK